MKILCGISMRLVILDDNDKMVAQYDSGIVKELLAKYLEVHKDIAKAFDQLSEDLLERARTLK